MMMKSYHESIELSLNSNWSYIPHDQYRILIIGGLGSSKTNELLKLIKHQQLAVENC